jgi:hypothetical protein
MNDNRTPSTIFPSSSSQKEMYPAYGKACTHAVMWLKNYSSAPWYDGRIFRPVKVISAARGTYVLIGLQRRDLADPQISLGVALGMVYMDTWIVLISEPMPCIDFLRPANHHEEKHTKQLHYSIGRNS